MQTLYVITRILEWTLYNIRDSPQVQSPIRVNCAGDVRVVAFGRDVAGSECALLYQRKVELRATVI